MRLTRGLEDSRQVNDHVTDDLAVRTKGKFVETDVVIDQSNILGEFTISSQFQELFLTDMHTRKGGHLFFRDSFGTGPFFVNASKQATKWNGRGGSWYDGSCSARGFSWSGRNS